MNRRQFVKRGAIWVSASSLLPRICGAAIAFNAGGIVGTGDNGGSGNFSGSYTCGSGANRILFVGVVGQIGVNTITAITYNGVAMTLIDAPHGTGLRFGAFYYLINPASGANTLSITQSGGDYLIPIAADYSGAKQSGQPDAFATTTDANSNPSFTQNITTVADNCWTIMFTSSNSLGFTAGSGSTSRASGNFGVSNIFDSNAAITPAGATSMTYTGGAGTSDVTIASFSPFVSGTKIRHSARQT
jgi:hypothetical protein